MAHARDGGWVQTCLRRQAEGLPGQQHVQLAIVACEHLEMRGHGGGVASPYGPRERRRGAGLQVGGRSADQGQVEAPGDLRGNTGRPGEPLGNGHQRGGVVRRERGAGVVGGLGARWQDHRLHAQRTGEVRRRRQRPVVAFDPGIGPCQALGGGCRIGDRLEGMERAEARPARDQRLQRGSIPKARQMEDDLVGRDRTVLSQLPGERRDRTVGHRQQGDGGAAQGQGPGPLEQPQRGGDGTRGPGHEPDLMSRSAQREREPLAHATGPEDGHARSSHPRSGERVWLTAEIVEPGTPVGRPGSAGLASRCGASCLGPPACPPPPCPAAPSGSERGATGRARSATGDRPPHGAGIPPAARRRTA